MKRRLQLPGRGWVRVDPTAAVAPERIYDTIADRTGRSPAGLRALAPMMDIGDWMRRGWNDMVLGFDADRQQSILHAVTGRDLGGVQLALLFALVACLALAGMLWLVARGERERDPMLRAWHRLGARYRRLGLGRQPHETAAAWSARVVAERPQATALPALTARFSDWRYAPGQEGEARALLRDLADVGVQMDKVTQQLQGDGVESFANDFRRLIERAVERGGTYYLTYHRHATRQQVEAAHPRFSEMLAEKERRDPRNAWNSDWFRHHRSLFD